MAECAWCFRSLKRRRSCGRTRDPRAPPLESPPREPCGADTPKQGFWRWGQPQREIWRSAHRPLDCSLLTAVVVEVGEVSTGISRRESSLPGCDERSSSTGSHFESEVVSSSHLQFAGAHFIHCKSSQIRIEYIYNYRAPKFGCFFYFRG